MMRLAFDRNTASSVRRYDEFGRLHVESTNISKAAVNGYYGKEIMAGATNGADLKLDPEKLYQLYRDPAELEKAAPTFNNIQVLSTHIGVSADQPREEYVAGSTGTDAVFEAPFLRNSLVIWRSEDIEGVEAETKVELSCSYKYRAIMEPGVTPDGAKFDGRMADIIGNHVALVEKGRAGGDVIVGDSLPFQTRDINPPVQWELFTMPTARPVRLSPRALQVHGALAATVLPKLAKDQAVDFRRIVLGTTALNFDAAKPVIVQRLLTETAGKLAKDEKIDAKAVHELLDRLDGEEDGPTMDDEPDMDEEDLDDPTMDEAMREAKDCYDKARDAKDAAAMKTARDAWTAAKTARDAMVAKDRAKDKAKDRAKDKAKDVEDETEEERAAREEREAAAKEKEKAEDRKAMDAAIAKGIEAGIATERQRNADLRQAEHDVMPYIGQLAMPQATAVDVYRLALDHLGVDLKGVPVNGPTLRAILQAQAKPGQDRIALAHDRSPTASKAFTDRFPAAKRIRTFAG